MFIRRTIPPLLVALALLVSLVVAGLSSGTPSVDALPPAGTDDFDVSGQVNIVSQMGVEKITLNGTATVVRGDPALDGGVEVVDAEIVSLALQGTSLLGDISVGMPTGVGPVAPGGEAADSGGDGDGFEVNASSAFQDGGAAAQDFDSGTSASTSCSDTGKDRHRYFDFGLNLPPAASVEGIQVRLDTSVDSTAGAPFMCVELSWDGGATWTAPATTPTLSIFPAAEFLGGPGDTWGRPWSPDDLLNDNFVVRITNVSSDNQRDFRLDYAAVSISFSAPSPGEIRSLQPPPDQFPASSFFDLSAQITLQITIPGVPVPSIVLHNNIPLRLTPRQAGEKVNLSLWPPSGVAYELEPIFGVDNDGDTAIDEDGPDDDGDGLQDEDRPGFDPVTPGSSLACGVDADCDLQDGEDPPAYACTLAVCDNDADGQIDEDPSCIPLFNVYNRHEKAGVCITNLSFLLGGGSPEQPTFSVAAGGPSGFHPADLLALTGGGSPPATSVSGNNAFADAWPISAFPFTGQQSTSGMTTEAGEPLNPAGCFPVPSWVKGATVWYRFTPGTGGTVDVSTAGSSFDTVLAAYTGSSVNALTPVACNDDAPGLGLQSEISFGATAGTTYYLQAGGFSGAIGDLALSVLFSGSAAGGTDPPFVNIPCTGLALSIDGCDAGTNGDQDDIDALSFGADFIGGVADISFSVAPGSAGLPGTAVAAQAACSPAQPQADEFGSSVDGGNTLIFDGDGQDGACPTSFLFGLVEVPTSDDLNALNEQPPSFVDANGDGVPEEGVFFSLAPGSPTLTETGRSAADVMWALEGFQPVMYAPAAALGLQPGDDIDALCLADDGDLVFDPQEDVALFSLTASSPTLASLGGTAADVLSPGPTVRAPAADLGLAQSDDLNAMKCGPDLLPPPTATPTPTTTPTIPATPSPTATATTVTPVTETPGAPAGATPTATPLRGPAGITAPDAGARGIGDAVRSPLIWVLLAGVTGLAGVALTGWGLPRLRRR